MKAGWETMSLSEAFIIKPPKKEAKQKLDGADLVSFVPMNVLGETEKYFQPKEEKSLDDVVGSYTYFADNDVLLAKITPCFENGKLGIARGLTNGIGFGSSEYIVFRQTGKVLPEYLYYYLAQSSFRDDGQRVMSGAVGHKRVPKEFIENHQIPVPPLEEQQRIVAILDEAFAGIATATANAEKNLQNARELFESTLQSVFSEKGDGWKEVVIEDVCESIIDCINKTAPTVNEPTPFKMIRTTNIRNGIVNLESVKYVTKDVYEMWTRRQRPQRGDVLLTREAPLGEVGIIDSDEKVFLGQRIVSYRVDANKLDNKFLLYALQSKYIQDQIDSMASGATVQHMRVPDSKKLKLPFPNLKEQRKVVEKLQTIENQCKRLEYIQQVKLEDLAELKQSILQKAFAGELH